MTAAQSPADFTIARLTRQRDLAEKMVDALSATVAALEREKAEQADLISDLMAQLAPEELIEPADQLPAERET